MHNGLIGLRQPSAEKSGAIKAARTTVVVDAHDRAVRARARPQKLRLEKNPVLRNYVVARLKCYWSPEQIAGRLRLEYPDNPRMHISHEAIYRAIYLRKSHAVLPKGIHHCLRHRRPIRYGKHYSTRGQWRSQITNAQQKLMIGSCLVLGTNFSQVATLVDRCTKEVHIIQLANRTASELIYKLTEYFNTLPQSLVKTLTWGRGMELTDHEQLSRATGIKVYFADPHSPWQ